MKMLKRHLIQYIAIPAVLIVSDIFLVLFGYHSGVNQISFEALAPAIVIAIIVVMLIEYGFKR